MTGRLLSAEELMKYFNGPVTELPQKGGPKDYAPDGSWLQAKQLEHFYKERTKVLSEERVKKKGHLAHGEWKPEIGMVEMVGKVGKFWQTTGHVEGGKYLLYPEEALGLVDKGDIEVYYSGLPLSMQECYAVLLRDNIPIEHYQVYIYLSRLGYIIFRHKKMEKLSEYENKLDLKKAQSEKNSGKKKKRKARPVEMETKIAKIDLKDIESTNNDTGELVDISKECVNVNEKVKCLESETSIQHGYVKFSKNEEDFIFYNSDDGQNTLHKHSDFSAIPFPSLEPGNVCELHRPKEKYLPKGISLQQDVYVLEWPRYTSAPKNSLQCNLEFSHPPAAVKGGIKARNWTEFKELLRKRSEDDFLKDSPVGHLWKGNITPLIKPSEAHSTVSLLERMKIIQNINFDDDVTRYEHSVMSDVKIIYDVYKSKGHFSKKSPGLPAFRLCIKRQDESPVILADMIEAARLSPDGVPVQWAIVDNGDVTFYTFHGVDLPMDVTEKEDKR